MSPPGDDLIGVLPGKDFDFHDKIPPSQADDVLLSDSDDGYEATRADDTTDAESIATSKQSLFTIGSETNSLTCSRGKLQQLPSKRPPPKSADR